MGKEKKYKKSIYNWPEDERMLDHIIIGDNNYFSFFNEGLIKK